MNKKQTITDEEIENIKWETAENWKKFKDWNVVDFAIQKTANLISSKKDAEWKEVIEGLKKDRQDVIDKYSQAVDEIMELKNRLKVLGVS